MTRIALLVNIVAPYRIPVYEVIAQDSQLQVFTSGGESNRTTWSNLTAEATGIQFKKSWGFTLKIPRMKDGKVFDHRFVHITPGYFFDLVAMRPHAVVCNEMGFRAMTALIYGSIFRKPVWVWWGGTLHTEADVGRGKRMLRNWFVRRVRRWISYGKTSTEYLVSIGVKPEAVLEIQNCVDRRRFSTDVEPVWTDLEHPVLLHVGQLINRKGIDLLLRAAAQVRRRGRTFSLVLVGGGDEKANLEGLAAELGLNNVHWKPACKPAEMPGIYRSADVVVFPTLEDVWGLVANEAILCGVPVLVSKFAGCNQEVVDPKNVFDPTDLDAFTEILDRAVQGDIAPAEPERLKSFEEVGAMIRGDMRRVIGK
ncbi:MAG: glycosyltransferase family 4 protein [Chthonomonas sp.]|nr:glycosyltransferase family 4 protein [Chthonomonas sp.]